MAPTDPTNPNNGVAPAPANMPTPPEAVPVAPVAPNPTTPDPMTPPVSDSMVTPPVTPDPVVAPSSAPMMPSTSAESPTPSAAVSNPLIPPAGTTDPAQAVTVGAPAGGGNSKKLLLIMAAVLVVLLLIVGGVVFFLSMSGSSDSANAPAQQAVSQGESPTAILKEVQALELGEIDSDMSEVDADLNTL